ncbi:MAG: hypothetical protein JWL59_2878 [Chthoniobacteraceae bacterium]|nr:hypothetical protein [Chthoniobacteraceae bacterium]
MPRREIRAWPLLILLLLVTMAAIGCVLWFMREAMRNERLAIRQTLADAYGGHIALAQKNVQDAWSNRLRQIAHAEPGSEHFEKCIRLGLADSVICLDQNGLVVYPDTVAEHTPSIAGDASQAELRALSKAGKHEETVRFVFEKFAASDSLRNGQGRVVAANAELMALELLAGSDDPRFDKIATRLCGRLTNYLPGGMPASQRRFLMHELQRLKPDCLFSTLTAEDLAARYLEGNRVADSVLRATDVPGFSALQIKASRVVALFETETLHSFLQASVNEIQTPRGAAMIVLTPGEEPKSGAFPILAVAGEELSGWRLALSVGDRAFFNELADRRAARYGLIASLVIGTMALLTVIVAKSFGRQMQIARLKNNLVATVSHELKTPLTAMRALVDTLLEADHFEPVVTRDYLTLISAENARLSRLIENFLTFSRLERNRFTFEFARISPSRVLEGAAKIFRERMRGKSVEFDFFAEPGLPDIWGDADALVTALLNLLDNAFKYSGADKRIFMRGVVFHGRIRFQVEDNGIGLSPGEKRRVFNDFYQCDQRLSRPTGGCGLGLSIVRSIAEAHGGLVDVDTKTESGALFTIELPAAKLP